MLHMFIFENMPMRELQVPKLFTFEHFIFKTFSCFLPFTEYTLLIITNEKVGKLLRSIKFHP